MTDIFRECTAARLGAADAVKSQNATKKYKYGIQRQTSNKQGTTIVLEVKMHKLRYSRHFWKL